MTNEIYVRVADRIRSMGLADETVNAKLEQYAYLDDENKHLSAYEIHDIATDLMASFHWVITGEEDPAGLHMGVRNVLRDPQILRGDKDWVEAEKALRDAAIAYEQVAMGLSPKFGWKEPKNIDYAMARFKEAAVYGTDLDFFERIEEFFGVDVLIIESDADFDAVAGMVLGVPFIVAKQGIPGRQGHYAVARELACILSGNLAPYSKVYEKDAPLDMWSMDFCIMFMDSFNGLAPVQGNPYAQQRFPERLVEAHRDAVKNKHNLGYFLEWMTGEKPPVVEHEPIDLDKLAELLGFSVKDK